MSFCKGAKEEVVMGGDYRPGFAAQHQSHVPAEVSKGKAGGSVLIGDFIETIMQINLFLCCTVPFWEQFGLDACLLVLGFHFKGVLGVLSDKNCLSSFCFDSEFTAVRPAARSSFPRRRESMSYSHPTPCWRRHLPMAINAARRFCSLIFCTAMGACLAQMGKP